MADVCTICGGTGEVLGPDNQPIVCDHCSGTGEEPDPNQAGGGGGAV